MISSYSVLIPLTSTTWTCDLPLISTVPITLSIWVNVPTHFIQQAWRPQAPKGAKMIPKKRKVSQVRDWRVRIEADLKVPSL